MNDAVQSEPTLATLAAEGPPALPGAEAVVAGDGVEAQAVAAEAVAAGVVAPQPVVAHFADAESIDPAVLEQRIEALEKKVDHLKNSPELEERIASRVIERLPQSTDRWYGKLNPFRGASSIPMPSGWIVYDLLTELRFVGAMIFDRRYAMSWTSRGIVAGALALAFTSWFWLACVVGIPILGGIVNTLVILFCGGVVFKILHREAERYRKFLENDSR